MSQDIAVPVSPVRAALNEMEDEFHLLEPAAMDAAIVGLVAAFGDDCGTICYDRGTVLDILAAEGMSREEAEGFFTNVLNADASEGAPRFLTTAKALMATGNVAAVRDAINELDGSFMLLEPADMDAAIAGLLAVPGKTPVTCYDRELVIDILMRDGMERDEAEEYFSFNIEGAYMGEETPVYLTSTKALIEHADLVN